MGEGGGEAGGSEGVGGGGEGEGAGDEGTGGGSEGDAEGGGGEGAGCVAAAARPRAETAKLRTTARTTVRTTGAREVAAPPQYAAFERVTELTGVSLPQFCERESRLALQRFPHRGDGKIAGLCGTHRL